VVAVGDAPVTGAPHRVDGIELAHRDAAVGEALEELRRRGDGAHRIVDHGHSHALGGAAQQQVGDLGGHALVLEDVALQKNA
jgi:hypothetical protein